MTNSKFFINSLFSMLSYTNYLRGFTAKKLWHRTKIRFWSVEWVVLILKLDLFILGSRNWPIMIVDQFSAKDGHPIEFFIIKQIINFSKSDSK